MMRKLVGWSLLLTMAVVGGLASPMAGQVAAQCSDAEKAHQFWVWRNGTTLNLAGGLESGRMVLQGDLEKSRRRSVAQPHHLDR